MTTLEACSLTANAGQFVIIIYLLWKVDRQDQKIMDLLYPK